jgi:hypothetical protein
MPTMQVDINDTFMGSIPPGPNFWEWPISWEYVNLTVIPISSNGNVQITQEVVTSDPSSNRTLFYNFNNNTGIPLDCFATLTLPHDSVA